MEGREKVMMGVKKGKPEGRMEPQPQVLTRPDPPPAGAAVEGPFI